MKFLDTSFLIDIRIKNPSIKPILTTLDAEGIQGVSSIVAHEFYFGGYNASDPNEISYRKAILDQFEIFPFDNKSADLAAKIEAQLIEQGNQIGRADIMIAATVLSNGSTTIYTRNVKHFNQIKGLEIITWNRMD